MSDTVPTVKVKGENGEPVVINLSDYVEGKHEIVVEELAPLAPLAPEAQVELFGSSIQPAGWNLSDGSYLQLGTVVAEAHKRSGLTVEAWNNLPQDEREAVIAQIVKEMVPAAEETLTVQKKRVASGEVKFFVGDASGKQIGEDFDTEEAAEAHKQDLAGEKAA